MSELRTDEPVETTEEVGEEEAHGGFPPVLYPVLALVFIAILVFFFSRVLLVVSEIDPIEVLGVEVTGKILTALIALFVAMNILIGAALVAYGRRVRTLPASWPLLAAAAAVVIVAGGVALGLGDEAEGEGGGAGGPGPAAITLTAEGTAFDKTELSLPAGIEVALTLDNKDNAVQHNFSMYADETGSEALFSGEIITGPSAVTYTFNSPQPGEYYFRCDVHPTQMEGTVTVTEGAPGGEPGPGGPEGEGGQPGEGGAGATLAANGIAFDVSELTVPGGGDVTITFDNMEAVPHNVAVYTDQSASEAIFTGEVITGPTSVDYTFAAPDPGEYFFRCDIHPTEMQGTLIVE
ncbi:MAG: cupredoxin domain-containing protein [Actinobacteria bacterium]|nr:cupredoxin domain-containing protein [Actinomycetota bacterium]